MDNMCICH